MNQISLINTVLSWERKLEIEEEKRKNLRVQPERYDSSAEESRTSQSLWARIFKSEKKTQPVNCCKTSENCRGMQFG